MTLENILTMSSGLDWVEGDETYGKMYASADWVNMVMDLPMAEVPGKTFLYCSGCSHVLSAIVQNAVGESGLTFAQKNLFQPLGITDLRWETDRQKIPIGGWGLYLTPRDMAKLGYLYLHKGVWDGQQVVSSSWVNAATTRHIGTDGKLGYGYQWWIYPTHGAYAALGRYGQTIFVAPDLNLIVVTTAHIESGHDPIFNLIDNYILPAVKE
jgi:CubicO group peptidase (beta-lactamase class C family)